MFAKSKQIGLASLFVVLASALGGCAESVGNEPATFATRERPVLALSRFQAPETETEAFQSMKTEPSAVARVESKRSLRGAVADAR